MKRNTNKNILRYALIPMAGFIAFAIVNPNALLSTVSPTGVNYLTMCFWILGCLGTFIFGAWGVMPHVVSSIARPLKNEAQKGRLKPDGHGDKTLNSLRIFKFLNIHIDTD